MNRFVKGLLAVPAEEIAEQRAIYEREKRGRRAELNGNDPIGA